MSPVGGPAARRLRGAGGIVIRKVRCSCGEEYEVSETAVDLATCPRKGCNVPTLAIPLQK